MAALSVIYLSSVPLLAGPRIWVFTGDPGDEAHHQKFEKNLSALTKSLTGTYGVPAADLKVFYGPRESGYEGICTREVLLGELKKAAEATRDPACDSVWIIFQGHANKIPGGAFFNIPGPDVSPRDVAEALKEAAPEKPLVAWITTTASESFVRPLAAPGRIVITANTAGDDETESDYPLALIAALAAKTTDTNKDGFVSVAEIFTAAHAWIESMNTRVGFVIREHAQMDGDGNGRGTSRPAPADATPAAEVGLTPGGGKGQPRKAGPAFD